MGHARTHTFCCCLPVRLGVFIATTFGFFGSLIIGILGWLTVTHKDKAHLTGNQDISLALSSLSYTLLAVVSVFGLVGAIKKHRDSLTLFSSVVMWHLGFSVISGSFFIFSLFRQVGNQDVSNCVSGSSDPNAQADCTKVFDFVRGFVVCVHIISWLSEFWACLIVAQYVEQLKEEEVLDYPPPALMTASAPPMATTYNYGQQYAFAQPENSFGQPNVNNV